MKTVFENEKLLTYIKLTAWYFQAIYTEKKISNMNLNLLASTNIAF